MDKIVLTNGCDYNTYFEVLSKTSRETICSGLNPNLGSDNTIEFPINFRLEDDLEIYYSGDHMCLNKGSKIMMSDGTTRNIEDIRVGDYVMSYDPNTKSLVPGKVTATDTDKNYTASSHTIYTLDDGTELDVVNRHEFYNMEDQRMKYIDMFKTGDHVVDKDMNAHALISSRKIDEDVTHYTLWTENNTYFVNGILAGNRKTKLFNI